MAVAINVIPYYVTVFMGPIREKSYDNVIMKGPIREQGYDNIITKGLIREQGYVDVIRYIIMPNVLSPSHSLLTASSLTCVSMCW
jgi:hypothetical protein